MSTRIPINLNDRVHFELTDEGREYVREYFERLYAHSLRVSVATFAEHVRGGCRIYERGFTELHDFMNMFGPAMSTSRGPRLFVNGTQIEIEVGL